MDREEIHNEWERGELVAPRVNIYETKDQYVIRTHMPGVKKDQVDVKFSDGELMIYGRVNRDEKSSEMYMIKEIEEGNYFRVFHITESLNIDQIAAKMIDGILTITLPKHERSKPRIIPIEIKK